MELLVHAGKSRQINDGAPAHILPDAGPYIKMGKDGCISHVMQVVRAAQHSDEMVQKPGSGRKKDGHHAHQGDSGNKVRHIGYRLCQFFESGTFYTVYHKRKHYGDREAHHQGIKADYQRIFNNLPETGQFKEGAEPFQPYPWAAQNALSRRIILKCHQYPVHGCIAENQIP